MTKEKIFKNDELNLSVLFSIIWKEKIKLILIWIFIFLIGYFLISLKKQKIKEVFDVKLKIEKSSTAEFFKFGFFDDLFKFSASDNPYSLLENNQTQFFYNINPKEFLDRFINEFLDYEEIAVVLENQKSLKDKLSNLSLQEKKTELYKYSRLFNIDQDSDNNFYITFTWHDKNEIVNIISEIGDLVFSNIGNSFHSELQSILEIKKFKLVSKDLERIEYLREQSEIAKEIGIKNSSEGQQIDNSQGNIYFPVEEKIKIYYQSLIRDDYLRGYKAIDKEINIIENRKYTYLDVLQQKLNSIKNKKTNWINYNLNLIKIKKNDNFNIKKNLILISVFALIFSVLVVLIFNSIQSSRISKI